MGIKNNFFEALKTFVIVLFQSYSFPLVDTPMAFPDMSLPIRSVLMQNRYLKEIFLEIVCYNVTGVAM